MKQYFGIHTRFFEFLFFSFLPLLIVRFLHRAGSGGIKKQFLPLLLSSLPILNHPACTQKKPERKKRDSETPSRLYVAPYLKASKAPSKEAVGGIFFIASE